MWISQWTEWLGYALENCTITDVLDDWDTGVKVVIVHPGRKQPKAAKHTCHGSSDTEQNKPKVRATIAPLRFLECHDHIRRNWRGLNCRQHVQRIKSIVYALHMRVFGMPYKREEAAHPPMSLQGAIEEVTKIAGGPDNLKLSHLVRNTIPKIQWSNSDYEKVLAAEKNDSLYTKPSSEWKLD